MLSPYARSIIFPCESNPFFVLPNSNFHQIGDAATINIALRNVAESMPRMKRNCSPEGLLISRLRHYQRRGPPVIPLGVDQSMIPTGLKEDIGIISCMDEVRKTTTSNVISHLLFDYSSLILRLLIVQSHIRPMSDR